MRTQPAWGLLFVGAVIVVVLFLSPIWLEEFSGYIKEEEATGPFPAEFYLLPNEAQDLYFALYESSPQMAVDFVGARLAPPVDIQEQDLLALDPNPLLVQEQLRGNFVTLDPIRSAAGTASIVQLSNGQVIVRLEDLDAINGPDLRVVLSAFPRPTTRDDLDTMPQYEIDLDELRGNRGSQNYLITEPTFNVDNYREGSVVLISGRYDIVFSFAPLAPPP